MGDLKPFDKYIKAEDAIGGCCLDGKCKNLNIREKQED